MAAVFITTDVLAAYKRIWYRSLTTLLLANALNFSGKQDFGLEVMGIGLFWLAALVTLITGYQYWAETRSFMAKRYSREAP